MTVKRLESHAVGSGLRYELLVADYVSGWPKGAVVTTIRQDANGDVLFMCKGNRLYLDGATEISIYDGVGDDSEDHF